MQQKTTALYRITLIFILSLGLISCKNESKSSSTNNESNSSTTVNDSKSSMAVMAYYVPSKTYSLDQIPFEKLTHIIFSFTEVIDNKMQFVEEEFDQNLKDLVAYKKQYPHLKVMIACGGWMGCAGFSDMAFDDELRKGFVKSTIDFVKKYDLDGVDMDWEYPGLPGAGNMHRKEDTKNFTSLMREIREGLDATGKDHTLTFASAGWERYYNFIETEEVMKYANYMNVMTYDLTTAAVPYTAHHTNFGHIEMDDIKGHPAHDEMLKNNPNFKPRSAESIVAFCKEIGVKPEQIIIGGAFYGRAWKGVPPTNNGLYQKNSGVHIGWSQYSEIRDKFESDSNFIKYWDPIGKAPYLYSAKDSIFISYDDQKSVALKTRFVKESGLGGLMFWQLTDDTTKENSLLDAIHEEVIK